MLRTSYKVVTSAVCSVLLATAVSYAIPCILGEQDVKSNAPFIITNQERIKFETLGDSSTLSAHIVFSLPADIAYSSSDVSVCSVDENGVVTATGDGNAIITISASTPIPIEKQITVHVERMAQNITAAWSEICLSAGSYTTFEASVDSDQELIYTSSDESIARISPDGTVEALSPGTAIISAIQPGNSTWQPAKAEATITVAEGNRDRTSALEPFFEAMRVQQIWSWDAEYGGGEVTIENSRVIGNCTTFPTACLQRIGLLPEPSCVWPSAPHAKAHPEYFEYFTPNQTAWELSKNETLQIGDIVRFTTPMMHSMIYMGTNDAGYPIWSTGGRAGGTDGSRPALMTRLEFYEDGNISAVLRIKTYQVSVSCRGNGIVGGGGEVMAKQNCTVTFHPQPGSTLVKLIVDGIEIPDVTNMSSYTFTEVTEPHSLEAMFS